MNDQKRRDGLEPRGTNTWRITVGGGRDPETNHYVSIRETFHGSKKEATRRRDELRVQAANGTAVRANAETVAEYLERWITHREHLSKVRPRTAYVYRGHVRRIVIPRIGSLRVSQVRATHVQRVIDEALGDGLSPRTVVQVYRILGAAFRSAVRWGAIAVSPCDGVEPPEVKAVKPNVGEVDELAGKVSRLLDHVAPDHRTALAVSAMTGLRRSEVLGLRWGSVVLEGDQPKLVVEAGLHRTIEGLVLLPPKSERSRRSVPMPGSMVAILRRHRTEQTERRLLAGAAWHDGDFVFDRGDGRPVDPDALGAAFRDARMRAGLVGLRLHDLRHAYATLQIAKGTDAKLVADLLGHATVAFTLQTYVHPDEDARAAAAETVERLLGPAVG
jgi:integrase